ncbi:alpha/beta hydrolase [uncultured Stenotrophomonas sp.]|uniref:alpha/beta fold hydrolase n=1 Tax=uncultured Stenotrophomonas sp. TaxID=165438 RepID=UPI0028E404B5|nr:alpha/beta hydrolase [uncultured Stenotrophomonas sp.]
MITRRHSSRSTAGTLMLLALSLATPLEGFAAPATPAKPTVVLVHGAFADGSSWNGVIDRLHADGYRVVAAPNELRSVRTDAAEVGSLLRSIPGPVVLVGHSYAGSVISAAADGLSNVKALVFVAAFAPAVGETAAQLSGKFPGSSLGATLAPPVALVDGGKDLYIQQDKFHAQFAADVPAAQARLMAATQRPITEAALNEASPASAWKTLPSWFVYGDADLNIPAAAQAFMAERAHARETVVIKGASHVVMVSHPDAVVALIEKAAQGERP